MYKYLLIFLVLGFSTICVAQDYVHLTTKDGLPTNNVYGVSFDKKGFAWMCTTNGVARFDGYNFKHFGPSNGLASNDTWILYEDSKGRLWCRSYGRHISYIQDNKAHKVYNPYPEALTINMFFEEKGTVYLTESRANSNRYPNFYIIKNDTLFKEFVPNEARYTAFLEKNAIDYLYFRARNLIYLEKGTEQIYLDAQLKKINSYSANLPPYLSRRFLYNPFINKSGWFFWHEDQLYRQDEWGVQSIKLDPKFFNPTLSRGIQTFKSGNNLVISDGRGAVLKLDSNLTIIDSFYYNNDSRFSGYTNPNIDEQGNIWISTLSNGILFLPRSKRIVSTYKLRNRDNVKVPNIIREINGKIYVGGLNGSLFEYNRNKTSCLISNQIISPAKVNEIVLWQNELVVSSYKIYSYHHKSVSAFHLLRLEKSLKENIKSLTSYKDSLLFYSNGLGVFWQGVDQNSLPKQIFDQRAYALQFQKNKGVWMGCTDGLYFYDQYLDSSFAVKPKSLSGLEDKDLNVEILKLYLQENTLWIGTNGAGLWKYDIDKKELRSMRDKMPCLSVTDIQYGKQDSLLWVGSKNGVFGYSAQKDSVYYHFTSLNTLGTNEVNCIYPKGDTLLVGTANGISEIPILAYSEIQAKPRMQVLTFQANFKYQNIDSPLVFANDENNIRITFSSLEYHLGKEAEYAFRIHEDKPWQTIRRNELEFNSLKAGEYTFEIYARNDPNQIVSIPFEIKPPFYQTLWFMMLCLFLLGAIVYYIYKWRVKQLKEQTQIESDYSKRIADLKLHALQSQMNPHFIFNALGSIQYFQRENVELADEYLGKFARLMRLFLESSKRKFTSVQEEKELIELYLQLEKVRLGDKLSYVINIDSNIDPEADEVPTMILQPFIENAVNHGIFHKTTNGNLKIDISKLNDEIIKIIIEDDGVGRAEASRIKENSLKTHTSRAMQIVQEKLDVIRQDSKSKVGFEIEDLFNSSNEPIGTRAILYLPC